MSTPNDGIHTAIDFGEYRRWGALSQSSLKHFARSPGYYLWRLSNPLTPTQAMVMGSAIDSALFDPEEYARNFVRVPQSMADLPADAFAEAPEGYKGTRKIDKEFRARAEADGRVVVKPSDFSGGSLSMLTAAGKAWRAMVERQGLRVLGRDERDAVRNTVLAVQDYAPAAQYLSGGEAQVSLLWTDEETGVRLKGRPDYLAPTPIHNAVALVDLKTTDDAGADAFERKAHGLRYHWQAAMYRDGLEALGREIAECVLVVAEREPPHRVEVYRFDESTLELGHDEYRAYLRTFALCSSADRWPLSTGEVQPLSAPAWAWK